MGKQLGSLIVGRELCNFISGSKFGVSDEEVRAQLSLYFFGF